MSLKNTSRKTFQWLAPLAALLALGSMEAWKATLPDASEGKPFLDSIKAQFAKYPTVVGDWEGTSGDLPKEAMAMLHPNFFLDRQYVNLITRDTVGMFLLEAEDSRDMMGHYPPNCYPGNGWVLVNQVPARNDSDGKPEWVIKGGPDANGKMLPDLHIPGVEYEFRRELELGKEQRLWVRNFFMLPNGTMYPEIASFSRAASDFYVRPYGATQVQVVYDHEMMDEDREKIFESLMAAHRNLIEALRLRK